MLTAFHSSDIITYAAPLHLLNLVCKTAANLNQGIVKYEICIDLSGSQKCLFKQNGNLENGAKLLLENPSAKFYLDCSRGWKLVNEAVECG